MKKNYLFILFLSFIFASCEYVDFDPPVVEDEVIESESNLVLKSATGYSSSSGTFYVQSGVGSGLKVESKSDDNLIESATWKIEGTTYEGVQIAHKFVSLGQLTLTVTARFDNGSEETRNFTVHSVVDISETDPVKVFTYKNDDGNWTVLFLIDKDRIKHATSSNFHYVGDVTDWQKIAVPEVDHNYVIDENGNPQLTDDKGKYLGVKMYLNKNGLYNFALVHSNEIWTDLSGSSFIKNDNNGLIWFWFEEGEISAQGSQVAVNLPGEAGDKYFRFTQTGDETSGKVTFFFKLENTFSENAFVVRQLEGGEYSGLITMWPVPGFDSWGQIELPASDLMNKVNGFRYGPNKSSPTTYSVVMRQSFFYDSYYKNLRIAIYKV